MLRVAFATSRIPFRTRPWNACRIPLSETTISWRRTPSAAVSYGTIPNHGNSSSDPQRTDNPKPTQQTYVLGFVAAGLAAGGGLLLLNGSGRRSEVAIRLDSPTSLSKPRPKQHPDEPQSSQPSKSLIPYSEVQAHNTPSSCWVIIQGEVYDLTVFSETHPGGTHPIHKFAGQDATRAFVPIHSTALLETLPEELHVGTLDPSTAPQDSYSLTQEDLRILQARSQIPPPEKTLNLYEIEEFAKRVLTSTAWAYYSSGGDDECTNRENSAAFKRYWFRPRVLRLVNKLSTNTTMLSLPASLPIFVSPAALARLGHPGGEVNIVKVCGAEGIIQGISNNASCSLEEITEARVPGQPLIFQIYLHRSREKSAALLRKVESMGFGAIFFTVDATWSGKREADIRAKGADGFAGPAQYGKEAKGVDSVGQAISGYQDPNISWDDIPWIQSVTRLPLVIKGIQCVEDAEKAYEYGVQGIVISNHGGRQLDYAPAPIDVLHELSIKRPDLVHNPSFEVYIDGGVKRGTDVLKALCLGARGVGLGRPFLYGNGVWGEEGVKRVVDIMREEITTGMRLLGVNKVEELKPEMVRYLGPPRW